MNAVSTALFAMLIATSAAAQERLNLAYRGVSLGDTAEHAQAEARKNFEVVQLDKLSEGMQTVRAGDQNGMRDASCPYAAPASLRVDCQRVSYSLNVYEGQLQVTHIGVKQSFRHALPLAAFMSRIEGSYGKPRALYGSAHDRTLLWGGDKTPPTHFALSGYPYGDSEQVGGKHILMRVCSTQDGVIGYELRISDHDLSLKRQAESKHKAIDAIEAAQNDGISKLKF